MKTLFVPVAAFAMVAALAGPVRADAQVAATDVGQVLADSSGMTLYTYDNDQPGTSTCYGPCAENWPPMPAEGQVSGDYSIVSRTDGVDQLAYQGKPLYRWVRDKEPGQASGDGVNGVWHAARP